MQNNSQKNCQSNFRTADLRQYLVQLYGGMFAGLVFLASVASCFGLAASPAELAGLLVTCLFSSALMFAASNCN